jgi:hypothetical protein
MAVEAVFLLVPNQRAGNHFAEIPMTKGKKIFRVASTKKTRD